MEKMGVISEEVRFCLTMCRLEASTINILRELTLGQLKVAELFSKLDANSSFWQVALSPASRLLTVFVSPSGRFCFNKFPFGISSAPEYIQKNMTKILTGLD